MFVSRVRKDADQYLQGEWVDQVVRECGIKWRDRLLTPLVTLRLFLLQVLHGNNPLRPGQWSPRVVRGRMKAYDRMTRQRATYKPPAESVKSG